MMRRCLLLIAPGALLGACTVGPQKPVPPLALPPVRDSAIIAPASGPEQRLVSGRAVSSQWWQAFGSARLDSLVERTLANNNDLAAAEANLRQMQEQARAAAGGQGPQLDANYQAQRMRIAQVLATPLSDGNAYLYTLHTAQVTIAYPLDLFGAGRNRLRSARAAADVAAERLWAARTTTAANLVLAVIQHASVEAQIAATRSAIDSSRQLVALLERRRAIGEVGEADVAAQQAALAAVEASLPPLERQLQHQAALIALLLGQAPGGAGPDLPALSELRLPGELPLSLPADIIAHRPDVRAAQAQVRAAAADLGSAIAARLPSVQLTGNAGGSATHFLDMFADNNPFFALIGGVTQPIFHAGQLKHQQRAAEAALAEAQAQYRAAALQAFLDVDDALAGLRSDAAALDAATRADAAAAHSLALTRRQVELGAQGTLALLNASSTAAQAAVQRVQAEAARLGDTVALFQACGTNPAAGQ